jgi:flagellar hook assembly protein FlgD
VRALRLAALLLALAPAGKALAAADPVTMVVRDVPLHAGGRTLAAAAPRFNMVGVHWQGPGTPWFRVHRLSGSWSAWKEADDDWGRSGAWRKSLGDWLGAADAIQFRLHGRVTKLREFLIWSPDVQLPARRLSIAGSPQIIPRSAWQADESIRRAPPVYAPTLEYALVHHTVNANSYSCSQSASIVRGIEVYHVKGNGWNDIGYNFLVDKCGQIFEGRYGGIDRNVVGAHSQGFNTGSVGVSVIGTYNAVGISTAARTALVNLLAWRLDVAHLDPLSFADVLSGGNQKFPAKVPVRLRAISGHRDTYFTECPGNALYAELPAIAQAVAKTGLPKLYAPVAQQLAEGQVRFTAKLSSSLPWTVTVSDATGAVVASSSGSGAAVDWTWDGSQAPPGQYTWTIASANVRAATGTFGGKGAAFALQSVSASPQAISPNADGQDDTATIFYRLTQPAQVTATLVSAAGATVSTLFTDSKAAGDQSFVFAADQIPDGSYTIQLAAVSATGQTVTAQVPVAVDRAFGAFALTPQVLSLSRPPLTATFTLAYPAHVTFNVLDEQGRFVARAFDGDLQAGAQTLTWDGTKRIGKLRDGNYLAAIVVQEPTGPVTHSLPFVADSTPPKLTLLSVLGNTIRFRIYEDATVSVTVGARTYTRAAKAGVVAFWLKPPPKHFVATVSDAAGNVSAPTRR